MVPIKLMVMDLDNTLLRSDLSISHRTRTALRKAQEKGVILALASSRAPAAIEIFSALLGLNKLQGYIIANNGTIVQDSLSGDVIFEAKIPMKTALLVFDIADAEGFSVQIYDDDIMYISRVNEYSNYDEKSTGIRQVVVENFRSMTALGCHKMLIPGDPAVIGSLSQILVNFADRVAIRSPKPYQLEILPHGVDKGSSLALLAKKCLIKREEVMAVGDSMNDESMLRWAGFPVAMKNADAKLKEIAVFITEKSNNEDGIAEAIGKYIL